MKKDKKLNYIKKKETIKKKTRELSILCGINGEVDTWPENPTDLNYSILQKKSLINGKKKVKAEEFDSGCLKNESLLVKLNLKLEAVEKRIEFLKMVNNGSVVVGDFTGSSRGKEVVRANQETHDSAFEFWESTVAINGDQLRNNSAYNQDNEFVMADQEFWVDSIAINGDNKQRNCSAYVQGQGVDNYGHDGQLVVMPNEMNMNMNMWETLNDFDNVQNFGCDDLWPIVTGPEFDILPQEATDFGTLLNSLLANDPFIALEPNYDYSIPFC